MRVRIERVSTGYNFDTYYETNVYVDDELVGGGSYGGEPEDNSIHRDYAWVEIVLADLAKKLGADVDLTLVEKVDGRY
jgi:hypothetical protein